MEKLRYIEWKLLRLYKYLACLKVECTDNSLNFHIKFSSYSFCLHSSLLANFVLDSLHPLHLFGDVWLTTPCY